MSPRKPKRRPYRSYGKPMEFGPWVRPEQHVHTLLEVHRRDGPNELIIDVCTAEGCEYESARDLIKPDGGDTNENQN